MTPKTQPDAPPSAATPRPPPPGLLELCSQLEAHGIACWHQGEGLLEDLRSESGQASGRSPVPRTLLCAASSATLLGALPRAVVTADARRRLTQATTSGPVDLLPMAPRTIESTLLGFGLSALAFAHRPADDSWCDPAAALADFARGELRALGDPRAAFQLAPRRYWISARLLAEHDLNPDTELVTGARAALGECLETLPQGAPARREITRVLDSGAPGRGLAFLRETGVSEALFPGIQPAGEDRIADLPALPALRWAAWLRGSSTARALVCLRVPHALARRIERIQHAHPIDDSVAALREVGIRRILQRLEDPEIEGLFAWRRLELEAASQQPGVPERLARLSELEARIERGRQDQQRTGRVRALALDGRAVMAALGAGPGPHVGRALAHLANFVEADPETNVRPRLLAELQAWSHANRDSIEPRRR